MSSWPDTAAIWRLMAAASAAVVCCDPLMAGADAPATTAQTDTAAPNQGPMWAVHIQATDVLQYHPAFLSPFEGRNSLAAEDETANTVNASLFLGWLPWRGGQFWFDEDLNQGFAPSNTEGVAGYVNGEGAKVGHRSPYYRPQRLFYRQTIALGGDQDTIDPGLSEFGGSTTQNRVVFTIGKFGLPDVVDDNKYAHDPENDFLNWAIIDTGTYDYAADAWGFSYGAAAEVDEGRWSFRAAVMDLSVVPNDARLSKDLAQFQLNGEIEHRERWFGREGKIKVLAFASRGEMGRFDDALRLAAQTGGVPDTALVRHYRTRLGISLNLEQPVSDGAGLFLRAGLDQGQYEPYEYADIDQTAAGGGELSGSRWGRKDDVVGLALVVNGISKAHEAYLAAGGLGILVGDGRLPHPGPEVIVEGYYRLAVIKGVSLTLDSQTVIDPAYNADRGPAEVIGLRLHGEY